MSGKISPPDPSTRGEPPERNKGFLPRMSNPILPPAKYNPIPWIVVVLEPKGELSPEQKEPPKVPLRYDLVGEAFERPLYSTTVGGEIAIRNVSRDARRLVAPSKPDLLAGDPINPKGDRIVKVDEAYTVIEITDADSAHLTGRLVAFPLRYHAPVDKDGSFEIKDVPDGDWTLRIWYETGWLKMKSESVSVSGRDTRVSVKIPDVLEIEAAKK